VNQWTQLILTRRGTPNGFDDSKVRTVSENATVLKFEQAGFEEE